MVRKATDDWRIAILKENVYSSVSSMYVLFTLRVRLKECGLCTITSTYRWVKQRTSQGHICERFSISLQILDESTFGRNQRPTFEVGGSSKLYRIGQNSEKQNHQSIHRSLLLIIMSIPGPMWENGRLTILWKSIMRQLVLVFVSENFRQFKKKRWKEKKILNNWLTLLYLHLSSSTSSWPFPSFLKRLEMKNIN